MKTLILFFVVIVLSSFSLWSQKNEDCLACHSEPDITMEKNGRNISLTVKKYSLARSVHGKLQCIGCHTGFNPDDIPHKEIIQAVNCTESCHKNASDKHLFHPDMLKIGAKKGEYSNCKKCHGTHEIISFKSFESQTHFTNSTNFCGVCHKDEKNDHLESQHFVELNKNNNIAPTCIFCHSYPITKGHLQNEAMLKINQEKLCLSCHLNNPNSTSKYAKSLLNYETSVHGAAIKRGNENAAVCVDCHGTHRLQKANDDKSGINRFKIPDVCGKCHVSVSQEYKSSIHGFGLKHGNKDVPGCTYCHGEHNITPLPKLAPKVFEMNRIKESTAIRTKMLYCVFCHTNDEMMSKYNISTIDKAHEWLPNISKHWETVRCVDCHSSYTPPNLSHNILPPEKTIKKCEECHSKNSLLMSKLYKHEKKLSREKFGFINGTILSDAYVIGTTRNLLLDSLSVILFIAVLAGIGLHAFLRWYFHKGGSAK